jgi:hypothetical protein
MSDGGVRVLQVTGGALKVPRSRNRKGTRKQRDQEGGDSSGALMQLNADRVPNASSSGELATQLASTVKDLLGGTFGPKGTALQAGGDNGGALRQLSQVPQMGGPMNTQAFQAEFRNQAAQALAQLGPDSPALQSGGKKQKGGDGISGTIQLSANRAPTLPGAPEPYPVISGVKPEQPAPVGGGRIILVPQKRKTRIALKPKKKHHGGSESAGNTPPGPHLVSGGAHTRKVRKIHLRVKGVTSRLAKAKKAKKAAMAAPITEVRQKLVGAGVIKKESKAPDAMLRNMYADLLITKKGL